MNASSRKRIYMFYKDFSVMLISCWIKFGDWKCVSDLETINHKLQAYRIAKLILNDDNYTHNNLPFLLSGTPSSLIRAVNFEYSFLDSK